MMLFANAHNDVMFALMCPQAHIIAEGNIISKASSFARKGKHHSKSSDLVDKSLLLDGGDGEIRPARLSRRHARGLCDRPPEGRNLPAANRPVRISPQHIRKRKGTQKRTFPFWRRWRDSNSRTAFNSYTISNRAPSTGLGDISESISLPVYSERYYTAFSPKCQDFFSKVPFLGAAWKKVKIFSKNACILRKGVVSSQGTLYYYGVNMR